MNAEPEPLPVWPDLMATLAGLVIFGACGWAAASTVAGFWSVDSAVTTSGATVASLQ